MDAAGWLSHECSAPSAPSTPRVYRAAGDLLLLELPHAVVFMHHVPVGFMDSHYGCPAENQQLLLVLLRVGGARVGSVGSLAWFNSADLQL